MSEIPKAVVADVTNRTPQKNFSIALQHWRDKQNLFARKKRGV
jgi:hypothetical protein